MGGIRKKYDEDFKKNTVRSIIVCKSQNGKRNSKRFRYSRKSVV